MYKCHHKEKWICCWVDCRIQEAKVERIYIYIYTYECIGWLVDLFVETVLHLCSTRFQMPSWKSLATKPWTSKSCGLDLFWNVKRSKNHHSKRPPSFYSSWFLNVSRKSHHALQYDSKITNSQPWQVGLKNLCLTDQRWIFQYRAIASRFNFWLTMPLAVRSTCHVWSSVRIQQIWNKNVTRNECKWGMFADVGMMLA